MIPRIFGCLIFIAISATTAAAAQETRGTIAGRALDEQGGEHARRQHHRHESRHERVNVADDE